ncbi:hypothetical protein NDU88_005491 [Pleurodeles waltl]|uniref:Uncharacterized protein n=1 Tax=Pleurodeles waltl TaxID=8319 RepID=A0AAV7N0E2_PLEWA|nr:hypothetical protein NDU88_005491 [Pleurodeles waltl]
MSVLRVALFDAALDEWLDSPLMFKPPKEELPTLPSAIGGPSNVRANSNKHALSVFFNYHTYVAYAPDYIDMSRDED